MGTTFSGPQQQDASRRAWACLVEHKAFCSQPYGKAEFAHARDRLDFSGWIPWQKINRVLCLAAGGGQQSALFGSLGCAVTVFDLSPEQLELDRRVARQNGFQVRCVEGDMLEVHKLLPETFDLVYQPISAHYVSDVRKLYRNIYKVVRPGGYYWVEHWSPFQMQLAAFDAWDGQAYRLAEPQGCGRPLPWVVGHAHSPNTPRICWQYIHSLNNLIGGLCDSGFRLLNFAERQQSDLGAPPGSEAHFAAYLPPFLAMFSQRERAQGPQRTR